MSQPVINAPPSTCGVLSTHKARIDPNIGTSNSKEGGPRLKNVIRSLLAQFGLSISRISPNNAENSALGYKIAGLLEKLGTEDKRDLIHFFSAFAVFEKAGISPQGQVLQDVFAAAWAGPAPFPVDCGAGRPRYLSNTWTLQQHRGWHGLLIEPNPNFAEELKARAQADVRLGEVAAGSDGFIKFLMLDELSCAVDKMRPDWAAELRQNALQEGQVTEVERISLTSLLNQHAGEPRMLDFLSLDVEGAEIDVLNSLDHTQWSFRSIAIEHADLPELSRTFDEILLPRGYRRVLREVSAFDAFFVHESQ